MRRTLSFFSVFILICLGFISCKLGDSNTPSSPAAAILSVNASPNSGTVDVLLNGTPFISQIPYGNFSAYSQVTPGNYVLRIGASGSSTMIDTNFQPLEGNYYSIFVVDSVSKMKPAIVTDKITATSSDSSMIRFFHFSPNTPSVDLVLSDGTLLSGARTFNDQSKTASYQSFTRVKAGDYNLEVRSSGTGSVLVPTKTYNLKGGSTYTIFLKGFEGGTGTQTLGFGIMQHN